MSLEIPRHWRLQHARYGLIGEECQNCETKIFPPRDICPTCNAEAKKPYQFSGKGKIYSHTTVYEAPEGHAQQAPYNLAMIELDEGPLVTAQPTDLDYHWENGKKKYHVKIGDRVEMVTRKIKDDENERGMIVYGYKFRPVLETSTSSR